MNFETALKKVWSQREEEIYPRLFGKDNDGIFVLEPELFLKRFRQETYDPRWLFYGVFEFEPTPQRASWLYVSSGMSNPWEVAPEDYAKQEYSGLGVEFVMETPARAQWAITVLQNMIALNLLLACGRIGSGQMLDYGHRIPLKSSITPEFDSAIRNVVITKPMRYPEFFTLPSGRADLLHFIGVTDEEIEFAKEHGSDALISRLQASPFYPLTDSRRA